MHGNPTNSVLWVQKKEGESNSFESIDAWLSMDMADLYIFDSGLNLTIFLKHNLHLMTFSKLKTLLTSKFTW